MNCNQKILPFAENIKNLGIVLGKKIHETQGHDTKGYSALVFCLQEGIYSGLIDKNQFTTLQVGGLYDCQLTFTARYSLGLWSFFSESSYQEVWHKNKESTIIIQALCQLILLLLQEHTSYDEIFSVLRYLLTQPLPCQGLEEWKIIYFSIEHSIFSFLSKKENQDIKKMLFSADKKIVLQKHLPLRAVIHNWSQDEHASK
jgi:hypothetical protein